MKFSALNGKLSSPYIASSKTAMDDKDCDVDNGQTLSEVETCLSDRNPGQALCSGKAGVSESAADPVCDSPASWCIAAASFVNCWVVGFMFIAFSMLYIEFDEHFETTKTQSSWIGSLFLATGNICGLIFSVFINRYGCRIVAVIGGLTWAIGFASSSMVTDFRLLYFSYGIVAGCGFNMVTLTSFVIVQQHFKVHRALAAGIAASGISVGSLTCGPLIRLLLDTFAWRGTLLMMAGIALNNCVFGAMYRPAVPSSGGGSKATAAKHEEHASLIGTLAQIGRDMVNLTLFKNMQFTLVALGTFLMNIGLTVFFQHTPSRAYYHKHIENYKYLPMTNGIATAVARILGGIIGNCKCTNRLLQYSSSIIVGGIMMMILGGFTSFELMVVFGACVAFCAGLFLTVQSTVLSDIVGVTNISRAQAFVLVFSGIGAMIGVPLAAFIRDKTENYDIPFFVAGAIEAFGGQLVLIAALSTPIRQLCGKMRHLPATSVP